MKKSEMDQMDQEETMYYPLYPLIMFEYDWDVKISLLYGKEKNTARAVICYWKGIKIMEAIGGQVYWRLPIGKANDIYEAFEEFVKPIFASKIAHLQFFIGV